MKESISVLIENLGQNYSESYCQMTFDAYMKRSAYFSDNFKHGYVEEESLLAFLDNSIKDERIRWFFPCIFPYVDTRSMTDKVFELCLNYPCDHRRSLIIVIAHMWLKEEYLLKLNEVMDTGEAFVKLFIMYISDNNISVQQLKEFMLKNERHIWELSHYKTGLTEQNINPDKIAFADPIINEMVKKRNEQYRHEPI